MPEFNVQITETLTKTVTVEAETQDAANWIAEQNWHKGDYILDADNFTGVVFEGASRVPEKDLRLKPGFKDGEIYDKFPDQVCYIPENWDFEEDGPGITANDILEMCDGDKLKAGLVFDLCEWEHPNTVLVRWDEDDDRALAELRAKQGKGQQVQDLQVKVIINDGIVEAVLKDQDTPVRVEVIDVNKDYADCEALEEYRDEIYHDPSFKDCDYTVANFEEDEISIPGSDSQSLNEKIQNAADRAGEGANSAPPKDKER